MIYVDNAATTRWKEKYSFLTIYGNPSSIHHDGRMAKNALEISRQEIAECLNCKPTEIIFTSGGSESDNLALKGVMFSSTKKKLITSEIEHPAILETCKFLRKLGFEITYIPVDSDGIIDLEKLENAVSSDTALISIMLANNEIGTIEPIDKVVRIARKYRVPVHTDAVQAVGAIPIDVQELGVDLLSLSGHKFGGPKGTGALYCREGIKLEPLIHGGGQERGFRAGTENLHGIMEMADVLIDSVQNMEERNQHIISLKNHLITGIASLYNTKQTKYKINGSMNRLPNNLNVSFPEYKGNLVVDLDYYGIECSSGSACSNNSNKSSHVLRAIGCTKAEQEKSIRFTLGKDNTKAQIDRIVEVLGMLLVNNDGEF